MGPVVLAPGTEILNQVLHKEGVKNGNNLREGLNGKKRFRFCPNEGGGGLPMPDFWPFFKKCIFGQ